MFDFKKLDVYHKAKSYNHLVYQFVLNNNNLDRTTRDQFRRASFSIMLNLAEGSGKFSKPDRRNFFIIARSSIFECVAIIEFLIEENMISQELHDKQYYAAEEISKMLLGLIHSISKPS